jgi:hypothetical protein
VNSLDAIAIRANLAIQAKGPVPIPTYAGLHFYSQFRANGGSLQGLKARKWYWLTSSDATWLDSTLAKNGF